MMKLGTWKSVLHESPDNAEIEACFFLDITEELLSDIGVMRQHLAKIPNSKYIATTQLPSTTKYAFSTWDEMTDADSFVHEYQINGMTAYFGADGTDLDFHMDDGGELHVDTFDLTSLLTCETDNMPALLAAYFGSISVPDKELNMALWSLANKQDLATIKELLIISAAQNKPWSELRPAFKNAYEPNTLNMLDAVDREISLSMPGPDVASTMQRPRL